MEQKPMMTLKDMLAETRRLRLMGMCPACKKEGPFKFDDKLSVTEYGISGLCQSCQNEIFREEIDG